MLLYLALGAGAIIAGVLGFAATRPNEFRYIRSRRIKAPPEKIFPHLNDFRKWDDWSPWAKLDPQMKQTHSGAASGTGARYEWDGNSKVGRGRMEITESSPPSRLMLRLEFDKPFKAVNTTEFVLRPAGDGTDVDWIMYGPNNYPSKVMGVFVNMDRMIGRDFETGLANLGTVAER